MDVKKNGDVSFWYADIGGVPGYRPPLQGDIVADVCIVGAGYTGLWTAYYLKQAAPAPQHCHRREGVRRLRCFGAQWRLAVRRVLMVARKI